jgi:signal transduction histidine kinase/CHASE1-domain containing sensor protein
MLSRLQRWAAQLRTEAVALLVLGVCLAGTVATAVYVGRVIALQEQARFDRLAQGALAAIRDRIDAYVATLRATRGLFSLGREPTREEFRAFVAALELDHHYPGIQGIGYSKLIAPEELEAHERAVRQAGFPGYRVWPEGRRDAFTSILYIEPFDWRNQRAFGYDMMSEPIRREAMLRARRTGDSACSARVELVQEAEIDRQPGFLIYLPVYAGSDERGLQGQVLGFVYAPFRAGDLLGATLSSVLHSLAVEVYDGSTVTPGALLFSSSTFQDAQRVVALDVAGRPWTVRLAPADRGGQAWQVWAARAVFLVGLAVSLLLFRVTRRELRAGAAARRAAARARFLADAGKLLSASLDHRATLAAVAQRAAADQCDWCIILLVEPEGPVRLVGHRDPAQASATAADLSGLLLDPQEKFGAAAAMREGESYVVDQVDDASFRRIARTPEQLEALRARRVHALMTVPLRTRGEALGAITFVSADPTRRFEAADVAMAEDLGRLAAAAVDTSRLYRRAQEAVRLRDDFLSIASHELKTPLTSLSLQSDSLVVAAGRGNVPDVVARKAEVIRRNVDRLGRLIANLLDISRMEAGRLEVELEPIDLGDVVREVTGRFEDELARAGCELRLQVEGPAVGLWDRLRLDQVVTNLVANAVKYGPGQPITVAVRAPDDERVVLTVRDEGIGIPADAQERIFERFERAVTERHYGGFGLGLWIVRRVLEVMGGTIRVESAPGQGATFIVELRRRPERKAEPGDEEAPPAARSEAM